MQKDTKIKPVTGQDVLDMIVRVLSGEGESLDESMENMSEVQIMQARVGKAQTYIKRIRPRFIQVIITESGRIGLKIQDAESIASVLASLKLVSPKNTEIYEVANSLYLPIAKAVGSVRAHKATSKSD